MLRSVILGAVPSTVSLHIGVGSASLPPGKNIVNRKVSPETVPETVPALFLWHEAHVPSFGLAGREITVPHTAVPLCVSAHCKSAAPCVSDPVPVHVPLIFTGRRAVGDARHPTGDNVTVVPKTTRRTDLMGLRSTMAVNARTDTLSKSDH